MDKSYPEKCETCIHNEVCHYVAECLNYMPNFVCEHFNEMVDKPLVNCITCKWNDGEGFCDCPDGVCTIDNGVYEYYKNDNLAK